MENFFYHMPTRIEFGKGVLEQTGKIVKELGATRVLLHYDGGEVLEKTGILNRVREVLAREELEIFEMGGVIPNPRLSHAQKAIALCKREKIDYIVALGGGSTIDSAKCVALGAVYEGDVWDFYGENPKAEPLEALPIAVVLTIPATGSEANNSSVMTKEPDLKRAVDCERIRPSVAVLDPSVTFTVPPYQTAAGIVDMLSHIMERYFTKGAGNDLTDQLCEAAMRSGIGSGRKVMEEPQSYDERANLMWLSTIANNGMLAVGRDADLVSHMIEHELSGEFDIVHGAGMAVVLPAWMKYVSEKEPEIFIKYATRVWGIPYDYEEPESVIPLGIEATIAYFGSLGMPTKLSELVDKECLDDETLRKLAARVRRYHKDGTVGSIARLDTEDLFNILKNMI